jgi:hypothetical protein
MKGNLTRAQLLRATRTSGGTTGGRGPAGADGAAGAAGVGVPTGGSTSQVLAKASNTNYDTAWVTPGGVSDGDKGDITVSASGATWTIDAGAVTLAKVVNIAANSILGNNTGSPATAIQLTASQVKTLLAIAAGDVSGLGTLATQSGTFSGTSSGTNTGDQTLYNQTIEDEGTPLTQRGTVNFVGAGVAVTDAGGKTTVTIAGGAGANTAYAPGSFTVATGNFAIHIKRLQLTSTQRMTLAGTARFRLSN